MTHKIDLISYKAGADDKEKELIEEFEKIINERIEHPLYAFDSNKLGKKKIHIEISQILKERILILEELKNKIQEKGREMK